MKRNIRFNRPQFVVEQIVIPAPNRILARLYPARVLVAWLREPEDIPYLAGEHRINLAKADHLRLRQLVRNGNRARSGLSTLEQGEIVREIPSQYEFHQIQWRGLPQAQPYINEGWDIKAVRLPKVVSAQQVVEVNKCNSMMELIHPTDFKAIAELCLSLRFDSFLQVAYVRDRYVLRNGYHRANALLRSGVAEVPALVRKLDHLSELRLPEGLFTSEIIFSKRPPVLADFLDADLAATIN